MSYSFKLSDTSPAAGFRRIAEAQTVLALTAIDDPVLTLDQKVHAVRRRIKKLRALLRLVRPVFPDFGRENEALREAAKRLSTARDAAVMIETFDKLLGVYAAHLDAEKLRPVRAQLLKSRRKISDKEIEDGLEGAELSLKKLRKRIVDWTLEANDEEAFEGGLAKSYRRARSTLDEAKQTRQSEDVHEWRKWTKYHWLQLRLLNRVWPDGLALRISTLDQLTDDLGEHHDLSVLCELLRKQAQGEEIITRFIDGPAKARLMALEESAFANGDELFAEGPNLFARKCAAHWIAWRKGTSYRPPAETI